MLDIGGWEFLVVAFVLLMVVGPKELPKMLRGFTRAIRHIRGMASEFTRGMEDLASESDLGDLKSTVADVKSGNLDNIADKIDFGKEIRESVADIKSNTDLDVTAKELSDIKNIGGDAGQQMASASTVGEAREKTAKAKTAKKKTS